MRLATKQIDAIVPFLEVFEAEGVEFGKWTVPEVRDGEVFVSLDSFALSDQASAFVRALYDNGWIANFDWPSWQDEAIKYVESPELIAAADLETIRKLLTTHVRKDRFCSGHLAVMFENGHITGLLQRIKELRPTVVEDETKRREEAVARWRKRKQSQTNDTQKVVGKDATSQQGEPKVAQKNTPNGQMRLFSE